MYFPNCDESDLCELTIVLLCSERKPDTQSQILLAGGYLRLLAFAVFSSFSEEWIF
jgi:hypothetical protein